MRVTLIKDGKVENIIEIESFEKAEAIFNDYTCLVTFDEEIGDLYDGSTFTKVTEVLAELIMAKTDFMNSFTMTELVSVYTKAKTDIILEVFLSKLNNAQEINLRSSEVVAGVNYLMSLGIIDATRVKTILRT